MSATCWQHVGKLSKSCQIRVNMRVGADTKSTLTQGFCIRNHQQIVDTVVCTDTVVHTPRGGNNVDKLNKSKSSGHVNVLRLVRHWYTGGAAAVASFFRSRQRWVWPPWWQWRRWRPGSCGSGGRGGGGQRLAAKMAGNKSVDSRMTACNDESRRRTTTQQPTK